ERPRLVADGIENALFAFDPVRLLRAEETVEQPVRDHLRRQGPIAARPAHVALDALAERFLTDPDLEGAEAAIVADSLGDRLVNGRAAGSAAREHLARDQAAHRVVMAVAGPRQTRRRIIDPAEDVDVLAQPGQGLQTGSQVVVRSGLARDPV